MTAPSGGLRRVVAQVIPLEHAEPATVETLLEPFLTQPGGSTFAITGQRMLVITDFEHNLPRLLDLIELADRAPGEQRVVFTEVELLPVAHLATELKALRSATLRRGGGQTGTSSDPLQMIEQGRTNELVLIGPPEVVEQARSQIERLDRPSVLQTRTYGFTSVAAKDVDSVARALLHDVVARGQYESVIDDTHDLLIVTTTEEAHHELESIASQFDSEVAQTQPIVRFHKLHHAHAVDVLATISQIEGVLDGGLLTAPISQSSSGGELAPEAPTDGATSTARAFEQRDASRLPIDTAVGGIIASSARSSSNPGVHHAVETDRARVVADSTTNTIIVVAEPDVHAVYAQLIGQLDVRRPQVLVEITFITLDTSSGFSLGVEIGSRSDSGDTGVLTFSSFGLSEVDPDSGSLSLIPGLGFNGAVISPDIADVVIRALSSNGRASVRSAPRILVNDNATGSLNSVSDAPLISVNASNTVATTSFAGFASAGTIIEVSPRISEGDYLNLEYSISLSSFSGEGGEGLPPPRQRNELRSEVTIPDGHTVIIGGLNRNDETETINRVPLLGELPFLEHLFSNRTRSQTSSTLFVFIRPIILRDDEFEDLKYLSGRDGRSAGAVVVPYPTSRPMLIDGDGR